MLQIKRTADAFCKTNNFKRQKNKRQKQRGFLSIEAIIVIVVVLALLGLGASKFDMLGSNADATEELSNVQSLFANTKSLKTSTGYGATGADLVPALIATKSVPKNMTISSGALYNLHNGTVTVVSNGTTFTLSENSIPAEACIKLATKISRAGTFASTKINSNTATTGEVSSAVAAAQCTGATNTVAWTSAS